MTDSDEGLLTVAKLREVIRGDLDGGDRLHDHAGVVPDDQDRAALSFVESAIADTDAVEANSFARTQLGSELAAKYETDAATRAVANGNGSLAAHLVGITEQDLNASSLTVTAELMQLLDSDGTLTTVLAAGRPNTGKSNTMFLLLGDMARIVFDDDLLVISNADSWDGSDLTVTSMHDLMLSLVEYRERPKTFVLDEASRHMDARTNSYEVASQWSPAIKSFSKLGVEACGAIGHTGKDVDPEAKRLTNLAFWKDAPEEATFYERWPAESDRPDGELFPGELSEIEPTLTSYDPDDVAPWSWDLDPDVWDYEFDTWSGFRDRLLEIAPEEV
jgi:hypothetical protein